MKNQNNRKVLLTVTFVAILTIAVIGTSFAFFNYTRTGSSNTVKTGRIYFTSSQEGTFNLTNVFPIATSDALSDSSNSQEVVITVSGDTTYSQGIEYLVTLEDVNVRTNTYKKVPVGLMVTPEKTGELGTSDNAYFTNRGGNTSIYKSFIGQSDILEDGQYVLVGYIRPGAAEVNGTIGIRAFIDKDSIAITDTPEENTEWQNGRMVLSTSEWNSLQTNGITFKVRVVANEGVWVGEPTSRNDMKSISGTTILTSAQKSSITEINFIRMSEEMINTHSDLIDLTASGGQGVVKGWIENNKLYIASPGVTYFPENSASLFSSFSNVTKINFNNVNTSSVTDMSYMFQNCNNLINIDLSNFDTSNVTNMSGMFMNCSSLANIDLSNFDTRNVTSIAAMFYGCSGLTNIDLSSFDTSNVTNIASMFNGCSSLTKLDLSNFNTSQIVNYGGMTAGCTNLETLILDNWNLSNLSGSVFGIFSGCSSLKNISCKNWVIPSRFNDWLFRSAGGGSSIEKIDVTGWDLSNTTNIAGLFANGSSNFTTIVGLETWDTSNITNMSQLFEGCTGLTNIDLSNFDTSNVTNMSSMFDDATNLITIYVGNNWNTSKLTSSNSSTNMFYGCTSLVGGNGTVFDSSKTDKTYAVVDAPSTPGYLTFKNAPTSNLSPLSDSIIGKYNNGSNQDGLVAVNTNGELYNGSGTIREYRYSGGSPKNYVTFNGETWRIIGVFDEGVKIVRGEPLSTSEVPETYSNLSNVGYTLSDHEKNQFYYNSLNTTNYSDWTKAGVMYFLNENNTNSYYNTINSNYKNMINRTTYYLGNVYNKDLVKNVYNAERGSTVCSSSITSKSHENSCNIWNGNSATWTGVIALIYPSDFGYAADSSLWNTNMNDYVNSISSSNSWILPYNNTNQYSWGISPASNNNTNVFVYRKTGYLDNDTPHIYSNYGSTIRPTLYLKSTVALKSGDGSLNNPYVLKAS